MVPRGASSSPSLAAGSWPGSGRWSAAGSAMLSLSALAAHVVVTMWLKRRTCGNIVWGITRACRAHRRSHSVTKRRVSWSRRRPTLTRHLLADAAALASLRSGRLKADPACRCLPVIAGNKAGRTPDRPLQLEPWSASLLHGRWATGWFLSRSRVLGFWLEGRTAAPGRRRGRVTGAEELEVTAAVPLVDHLLLVAAVRRGRGPLPPAVITGRWHQSRMAGHHPAGPPEAAVGRQTSAPEAPASRFETRKPGTKAE